MFGDPMILEVDPFILVLLTVTTHLNAIWQVAEVQLSVSLSTYIHHTALSLPFNLLIIVTTITPKT